MVTPEVISVLNWLVMSKRKQDKPIPVIMEIVLIQIMKFIAKEGMQPFYIIGNLLIIMNISQLISENIMYGMRILTPKMIFNLLSRDEVNSV